MDKVLLSVAVLAVVAILAAVTAWIISLRRERSLAEHAREWLPVEAQVEAGSLEGTHETNKLRLPTFAFSYQAAGEYYSGRFSLMPKRFPTEADINSMIDRMVGRKLLVRYNPDHPDVWFIPVELIDGYKVEQKIGPHVIHDYSPHN